MKTRYLLFGILLALMFFSSSCGYHNPYVYTGPEKKIYLASWKNRTNQLQLDSDLYQNLVKWYQRSDSIKIVKDKKDADLILGGEIISISLPSLSYDSNNSTKEVKIRLTVRYILKDLKTDMVLFQVHKQLRTEDYTTTGDSSSTADNEKEALDTIIDELSQDIYSKTLSRLSKS